MMWGRLLACALLLAASTTACGSGGGDGADDGWTEAEAEAEADSSADESTEADAELEAEADAELEAEADAELEAETDADADAEAEADEEADPEDGGDAPDEGTGEGECVDGDVRCTGGLAETCSGGTWGAGEDCTAASETCVEDLGCVSPCEHAAATRALVGCEFWAVDQDNAENSVDTAAAAPIAVVVVNAGASLAAETVVERDLAAPGEPSATAEVARVTVAAGTAEVVELPRWDVDGDNAAGIDSDPQTTLSRRVFRITSTFPVAAYVLQPRAPTFSNSVYPLRPTAALGADHYALVWPPANPLVMPPFLLNPNRDSVTIVGVEDATTVWVTPSYDVFEGVGQPAAGILPVAAIPAGTRTALVLDSFDVLNLESRPMTTSTEPLPDFSGTRVEADGPVVVLAGVDLAVVGDRTLPDGSTENCCAEFMGVQVPPTDALHGRYVVSRSPTRSATPAVWLEYDDYRVLAIADGTTVTTTLTETGLDSFTLDAGEWRAFSSREGFVLRSDAFPVLVAQYLPGRDQVYGARPAAGGDPDMAYVPAVEEWGTRYLFVAVEGYAETWASITMPDGASATIDGADVATSCTATLADGELDGEVYRAYDCPLSGLLHEVTATGMAPVPIGVMVFGYGATVSYQYPATPVAPPS